MKLATSLSSKFFRLSPKRLFRSKSKSSVSRSEPSSFSSGSSSSDGSYNDLKPGPAATPVSVLPGEQDFYSELVQAFKLIDRDDDGVVSRRDLAALLSRLSPEPPSQEEVTLMLQEVDGGDQEGCISLEELASRVAGASSDSDEDSVVEMREVFEFFDVDHDGRISAEELHRVFGVIGDERCTLDECVRMIATVDGNGDGFVCFRDFCRMMQLQGPAMSE
ncbi:putative calcium-binding protein CML35 [Raphanus sativus]|uniref:Probable calcium-binding protein CML35 n=1 Tax=Raphanus sativus TaxID=3726 RepID=A0A9W3CZQ8_RAPSA|nr:probable calcium-binding protein CML35 [Raphanus sativus]KAJ4866944.1 putative calcium-binding protein CML35 [Raphanus sativus]